MTKDKTNLKVIDMVYISMFAVIMAICSWISVPAAVPFTLQTFGVFLTVGLLGGKRGTIAVAVYLLLGLIGLPVFAGLSGGIGYIMGSTGGYIVGFVFSSIVMWAIEHFFGKNTWILAMSMVLGLLVCYAFGTAWFIKVYASTTGKIGVWMALSWCVIPYIIPDALKIALALYVCKRLNKQKIFMNSNE